MKKTAVEGILERIKNLSMSVESADSKWIVEMLIRDIEEGTKYDKSFLEVEREQLVFAFNKGYSDVVCTLSGIKKRQSSGEDFYGEFYKK